MMKSDWELCDECFLIDREKMEFISNYNITEYISRIKRNGATTEYILTEFERYKWSAQSDGFLSDEYIVDVYDRIHKPECEDMLPYYYRGFRQDFMKKKGWSFCEKCFPCDETNEMMQISDKNIEQDIKIMMKYEFGEEHKHRILERFEYNGELF
ncbi:MAG: hypothetical protein LUI08_06155 [Prevotella sp.]|nr:hypothetical protein [Prevotella sp.]